ncbi:MAG: GNAT family N-acetyltransferase [Acidobacteriota bacterium]
MLANRSIPQSVVIPELAYDDVAEAAAWLCGAFGFQERLRIGNHRVQLLFGQGAVVVIERRGEQALRSSVLVRVDDADRHHDRAVEHGAVILRPPTDYPFGERQYTAQDPGGHAWTFSQTIADVDPASWGGTLLDTVTVGREDLLGGTAATLIKALNAELSAAYPEPGATHFRLDPEETKDGRGAFVVARVDGVPMACGAIRKNDEETAEIKRMYVVPEARGLGLSRRVLAALEAEAARLQVKRIVLETGPRQLAALALYERSGFERIPEFGEYIGSPMSICMAKRL